MLALVLAVSAHAQVIDWEAVTAETTSLLSTYLQVDTVNPPGNETRGATFLAAQLADVGIESEILEFAPGRGSIVATLPGDGTGGEALCLLSHIDVVTSEAASWPEDTPPLGGVIRDGYVWGRGALDMKSMGILELQVMRLLARHEVPLSRDVVLLAVADEEVGNLGIQFIVQEHWEQIGCSHVINEGGIGLVDMFFPGQTVYPISVGEKGVLWGRLVATGAPGHGSTPQPEESPERLEQAVRTLRVRPLHPHYGEEFLTLLDAAGSHHGGLAGHVLRSPALVRLLLRRRLLGNPLTRAAVLDTMHITGLGGALQTNVVPGESWASIDARLLPGTDPDALEQAIIEGTQSPHVHFERLDARRAAVSEWKDDPLYEALRRHTVEGRPEAVAGPVVSVGFTDSIFLRPLGARAYGLVPFAIPLEDVATMHGNGERVSIENLQRGLQILYNVVRDVTRHSAQATD